MGLTVPPEAAHPHHLGSLYHPRIARNHCMISLRHHHVESTENKRMAFPALSTWNLLTIAVREYRSVIDWGRWSFVAWSH